jgi:3-mercaptopyruvate sulfurtransferase SseA
MTHSPHGATSPRARGRDDGARDGSKSACYYSASPTCLPENNLWDPVAGHILGAISAPTAENVNADGTFRPAGELTVRFQALGVTAGSDVGAYCGSGVTAAHEVIALALAGIPAALHAGSWNTHR